MTEASPPESQSEKPVAPGEDTAAAPAAAAAPAGEALSAHDETGTGGAKAGIKAKVLAVIGRARETVAGALGTAWVFFSNFSGNVKNLGKTLLSLPVLLIKGDLSTRLLLLGLIASVVLLLLTSTQLLERFVPRLPKSEHTMTEAQRRQAEREKHLAILAANVVFLERFSGTLQSESGKVDSFEIELYVEVDAPGTAEVLKANLNSARETVSGVILGRKYEALMTEKGKDELREAIEGALNALIHRTSKKGGVKKVFFTRFVME